MTDVEFKSGNALWATLRSLTMKAKKVHAAVGYFGVDGPKILPLPEDSVLVVDMSDNAVRRRLTSPEAIGQLIDDVRLFSRPGLHAKVFVFDDHTAIVGSTNVSKNSSGWEPATSKLGVPGLVEAGVVVRNRSVIKAAIKFVMDQASHNDATQVTPAVLEHALKLPRDRRKPPPTARTGSRRGSGKRQLPTTPRLWLFSSSQDIPEDDQELADALAVQSPVSDDRAFEHDSVSWPSSWSNRFARFVRKNDEIIVISVTGSRATVREPARVLRVHRRRLAGGQEDVAILEVRRKATFQTFSWFEQRLRSLGVTVRRGSTKELPPSTSAEVRGVFLGGARR